MQNVYEFLSIPIQRLTSIDLLTRIGTLVIIEGNCISDIDYTLSWKERLENVQMLKMLKMLKLLIKK